MGLYIRFFIKKKKEKKGQTILSGIQIRKNENHMQKKKGKLSEI